MKTHSLLWLFATIAVLLFAPLIVKSEAYQNTLDKELLTAMTWYGPDEVLKIGKRGQAMYRTLMTDTGLDGAIRSAFAKPIAAPQELAPGVKVPKSLEGALDHTMGYWGNLLTNINILCFRLSHAWMWFVFFSPFLIAVVFDGLMVRKAKIMSFKYTSPTIYNFCWHAIIAIGAFTLVYFALPIPVYIHYYPIFTATIGILIRVIIGNIQHSA